MGETLADNLVRGRTAGANSIILSCWCCGRKQTGECSRPSWPVTQIFTPCDPQITSATPR